MLEVLIGKHGKVKLVPGMDLPVSFRTKMARLGSSLTFSADEQKLYSYVMVKEPETNVNYNKQAFICFKRSGNSFVEDYIIKNNMDIYSTAPSISRRLVESDDGSVVITVQRNNTLPITSYFVFYARDSDGVLTETQRIIVEAELGGDYGKAFVLSGDGMYLFIGAHMTTVTYNGTNMRGVVYMYKRRDDGQYVLHQTIYDPSALRITSFGIVVNLRKDKSEILISAEHGRRDNGETREATGAVHLFRLNVDTEQYEYVQTITTSLITTNINTSIFGAAVSGSEDFSVVAIMSWEESPQTNGPTGNVYIYRKNSDGLLELIYNLGNNWDSVSTGKQVKLIKSLYVTKLGDRCYAVSCKTTTSNTIVHSHDFAINGNAVTHVKKELNIKIPDLFVVSPDETFIAYGNGLGGNGQTPGVPGYIGINAFNPK